VDGHGVYVLLEGDWGECAKGGRRLNAECTVSQSGRSVARWCGCNFG
jgi:hypothetical protein